MIKKSEIICLFCCILLISSHFVIGEDTNNDDWEKFISDINSNAGSVEEKVKEILDNDPDNTRTNGLLEYIKENQKPENKVPSELVIEEVFSNKRGSELDFKLGENNKLTNIEIKKDSGKETLELEVDNKKFNIDLEKLPEKIKGLEVTEKGLRFTVDAAKKQKIEVEDPKIELTEKDDAIEIKKYIGLDGEEHTFLINHEGNGRITIKEDGIIQMEGDIKIIDPNTGFTIQLENPSGAGGHLQFYKNGYVAKPFGGNNIIIEREDDIKFEVKKSGDSGVFVLADEGIDIETYTDFPSGHSADTSLLASTTEKLVFIPKNDEIVGFARGEGYFGIPEHFNGGVELDTRKGYGGGNIYGNVSTLGKGGVVAGDGGGGGGGFGGGGGGGLGGLFGGGGGLLNSILPYLLLGGGLLLVLALLGGEDDEESSSSSRGGEEYTGPPADIGDLVYNDGKVSTGTPVNHNTGQQAPKVQSIYN